MALVQKWTGREARSLRLALRMSMRTFASYLGVSDRTVAKWESLAAKTSPRPDTQAMLDTALRRADSEARARFRELVSRAPADGDRLTEATDLDTDDDVKRRALLTLVGPAVLVGGPIAEGLEQARRSLDGALGPEPTERDADEWEQIGERYAREVHVLQPSQTLPALIADFAELRNGISSAPERIRIRLIHTAAQMAALTAIALVMAQQHQIAVRWWRTAMRAAGTVDNPRLSALIAGRQAVMSLYSDSPERVVAMADRSLTAAGSRVCPGALNGFAARAQALARMGREADALATLNALCDVFTKLPSHESADRGSQWSWTDHRLYFVHSEVHSRAGRVRHAVQAQERALSLYPAESFQGPSQIEAHRAMALVRSGDVSGGAEHLAGLLDRLTPWQRHDGLVHRTAREVMECIPVECWDMTSVREVRQLLAGNR